MNACNENEHLNLTWNVSLFNIADYPVNAQLHPQADLIKFPMSAVSKSQ